MRSAAGGIFGGLGLHPLSFNEGGNVVRDLRAEIAAEAGARQTYEALINACEDEGTKKTLVHLLTREITHTHMSMKALDDIGKLSDPMFGNIPSDDTVKLVFNLSQGEDVRGPWNQAPDFDYIEHPTPGGGMPKDPINPDDEGHDKRPAPVVGNNQLGAVRTASRQVAPFHGTTILLRRGNEIAHGEVTFIVFAEMDDLVSTVVSPALSLFWRINKIQKLVAAPLFY
jgi:Manganese containing catalase